jgi:hypothetical protein
MVRPSALAVFMLMTPRALGPLERLVRRRRVDRAALSLATPRKAEPSDRPKGTLRSRYPVITAVTRSLDQHERASLTAT